VEEERLGKLVKLGQKDYREKQPDGWTNLGSKPCTVTRLFFYRRFCLALE
jgi:hypothetical protein